MSIKSVMPSNAIQPSHPLPSPTPPAFNLFQHLLLSQISPLNPGLASYSQRTSDQTEHVIQLSQPCLRRISATPLHPTCPLCRETSSESTGPWEAGLGGVTSLAGQPKAWLGEGPPSLTSQLRCFLLRRPPLPTLLLCKSLTVNLDRLEEMQQTGGITVVWGCLGLTSLLYLNSFRSTQPVS